MRYLHEMLKKAGAVPKNSELKTEVENIVATVKLPDAFIDLETLSRKLGNVTYIPEQFPAAKYRPPRSRVTFLFFATGIVTCAGAKSVDELWREVESIYERLEDLNLLLHVGC